MRTWNIRDEQTKVTELERWDQQVFRSHRRPTPTYFEHETLAQQQKRLMNQARSFVSPELQKVKVEDLFDTSLEHVARQFMDSAAAEARAPRNIPEGELREIKREDATGRQFSDFYGSPRAWMDAFAAPKKRLAAIYAPIGSFTKIGS